MAYFFNNDAVFVSNILKTNYFLLIKINIDLPFSEIG